MTIKKRNFFIGIWSLVFWFSPWSLCLSGWKFGGAIGAAARLAKIPLKMADIKVTAAVRLHKEESGFFIDAALDAELAGAHEQQAEALVAKSHTICPYSRGHAREYRGGVAGE